MKILVFVHLVFMAATLILVISAAVIVFRKKKGWFMQHRRVALSGAAAALAGFLAQFIFKWAMQYPHFRSPHAIGGLITLVLLLITPAAGAMIPKNQKIMRPVHMTLGRITAVAVAATAIMGAIRFLQLSS